MRIITTETEAFQGWDSIANACIAMGPKRVLRSVTIGAYLSQNDNGGLFLGDQCHNYCNHHLLVRILARSWLDNPTIEDSGVTLQNDEISILQSILRQINELVGHKLELGSDLIASVDSFERRRNKALPILLEMYLTLRRRIDPIRSNVARAWYFIHTGQQSTDVRIKQSVMALGRPLMDTVFHSIERYLFHYLAMFVSRGWIDDVYTKFSSVGTREQIEALLGWYCKDMDSVVGDWESIRAFPFRGLESPFSREPICRMGDVLVAPDPGALFSGLLERMILELSCEFSGDTKKESIARTLVGYLLEDYVGMLLGNIQSESDGPAVLRSFQYQDGNDTLDSPDFFVIDGGIVVIEVKASRMPFPIPLPDVEGLYKEWLREVCGARADRRPLRQFHKFIRSWVRNNSEIRSQVGAFPGLVRLVYLIVCPEDVPFFTNSLYFRHGRLPDGFETGVSGIAGRTLVVSMHDLEVLCRVAMLGRRGGGVFHLVDDYTGYLRDSNGLTMNGDTDAKAVLPRLAEYLTARFPEHAEVKPDLLSDVFKEATDRAIREVFRRDEV